VEAGRALLDAVRRAQPEDLWLGLWSGGASALIEVPRPGWTLDRIAAETERRMRAGEPIATLNQARREGSAIKGGQLAEAGPAPWWNLVLSDVSGDDPAMVGSGPAISPGGTHSVIGASDTALRAAQAEAFALRYAVVVLDADLAGEARDAGARLARAVRALPESSPPMALLLAGEPVVSGVPAGAIGGRMQELAVAAAIALDGAEVAVLAFATDGRDGSSEAAGALIDGGSAARGRAAGRDAEAALLDHASTAWLRSTGDLWHTGPTHTNVRDVVVALVGQNKVP
jgi:hydroxypyruvate reductase